MAKGKNKLMNILLDAIAVTGRAVSSSRNMLDAVDEAIQIDMSDDKYWKAADDAIGFALEFAGYMPGSKRKDDLIAELGKGRQALRNGMTIDFSDASKERLKAMLIPEQTSFEKIIEELKSLIQQVGDDNG